MKQKIQIVWLKKNLRILDNQCFANLDPLIPTIAVYFFESRIISCPDYSDFHLQFTFWSLLQLEISLKELNISLLYLPYNAKEWFEYLCEYFEIKKIFSHEETWNLESYQRDKQVFSHCKMSHIDIVEYPTNGIVRKLKSRDRWDSIWHQRIWQKLFQPVLVITPSCIPSQFQENSQECKNYYTKLFAQLAPSRALQKWWEHIWKKILQSFLSQRSASYMYHISKPYESQNSCSRLSPYITYGCLSVKYVCQETMKRIEELKNIPWENSKNHSKSLSQFMSRLHWQSHFIQKLEDEPEMEYRNLNADFNNIRTKVDSQLIERVFAAQSGIPYIDSIVRQLQQTGWTNFRSRAMFVSFLCNTCMQPWQAIAPKLAQLFTDYEPWIHYPQLQMQAATTWINTIRIYNPVYNGKQKDENWKFIYSYLPELSTVPKEYIHEPHLWNWFDSINYPSPVVDVISKNREAKELLWSTKRNSHPELKDKIIKKHASRSFHGARKKVTQISKSNNPSQDKNQISLF